MGVRRWSFDFGEIKRAADGGASIDCCCNYNAILAQSQMKLFRTELGWHPNVSLRYKMKLSFKLSFMTNGIVTRGFLMRSFGSCHRIIAIEWF